MSQSSPIWNASLTTFEINLIHKFTSQSSPIWNASLTLVPVVILMPKGSQSSPIWNASLTLHGNDMLVGQIVAVLTYMECFSDRQKKQKIKEYE